MGMQIEKLGAKDKKQLIKLYSAVRSDLRRKGIKQWDFFYPNAVIIGKSLKQGETYGYRENSIIMAAVVVDREQSSKYAGLGWTDTAGSPACIHRLAVRPDHQGKGLGKRLLVFAEGCAKAAGASSIRLDVFKSNPGAVSLYERSGYQAVGTVAYPMRKKPFLCMEKIL